MVFFLYRMVFFKKNFEDSLLSKNHCKVRSKQDASLLSASREKPAPPLTHTTGLIMSMCGSLVKFGFAALGPLCTYDCKNCQNY